MDIYPYYRLIASNAKKDIHFEDLDDSILLQDLINVSGTFKELAQRVSDCKSKYLLSGTHHYTRLFKSYLSTIDPQAIIGHYKKMFAETGFSLTSPYLISQMRTQDIYSSIYYDASIHARTLIDSYEGHSRYLKSRPEFYGWLGSHIYSLQKERCNRSLRVFIASDSHKDLSTIAKLVKQYGHQPIMGSKFSHTSLSNIFGIKLLTETTNLDTQLTLCKMQSTLVQLNLAPLADLIQLSRCYVMLATDSTFSQMAFLLGGSRLYHCFEYQENSLLAFK